MNIRRSINLIESLHDEAINVKIAEEVASGTFEGFKPYWKLIADPRVLEDSAALAHISTLIMDGYTSGMHPTWELKMVDEVADVIVDEGDMVEDILLPPETPTVSGAHDAELDEEVIDIVHAYTVVPVAETHGEGNGWYEVSRADAVRYVVEDEHGGVVDHFDNWEEARALASKLNSDMKPSDMDHYKSNMAMAEDEHDDFDGYEGQDRESYSDDQDRDSYMVDDEDEETPTMFDDKEDYVVIINAIHERGPRQQQALEELNRRGLWLSDEQKRQAGLL